MAPENALNLSVYPSIIPAQHSTGSYHFDDVAVVKVAVYSAPRYRLDPILSLLLRSCVEIADLALHPFRRPAQSDSVSPLTFNESGPIFEVVLLRVSLSALAWQQGKRNPKRVTLRDQ